MMRGFPTLVLAVVALVLAGQVTRGATLYDASPGQTPVDQGWSFVPLPAMLVNMSAVAGGTSLQTTTSNSAYAGFFRSGNVLNRVTGYSLNFNVRIDSEAHANNNRSGFSVIALSSDLQGIELSFWTNEIFAKESDIPTFSHAEGLLADTTILRNYQLTIQGNGYTLTGSGLASPLTGVLRDYSADNTGVYDTPNFLFFGDDTTSAGANILLGSISLQAIPEPGTWALTSLLLLGAGAVRMRRTPLAA
jgi:hypothetical protein